MIFYAIFTDFSVFYLLFLFATLNRKKSLKFFDILSGKFFFKFLHQIATILDFTEKKVLRNYFFSSAILVPQY